MFQFRLIGCLVCLLAACAPITPPSTTTTEQLKPTIASLVEVVRQDPTKKPLLAQALMAQPVVIVPDPHAKTIVPLKVDQNERSFIPVFSDLTTFDQEAYGTGFEKKAITVEASYFASVLSGNEIVILNPGHRPAIEFRASELQALISPNRSGLQDARPAAK